MNTEKDFKKLFDKEYIQLCKYAYSYMQDEHLAEDVVQETFIKIWEQKKALISSPDVRFYLVTAVRNNCISAIRKTKSTQTHFTDNIPAQSDPEPFLGQMAIKEHENQQTRKIQEALNMLPPKCKEVFLLVKLQGMSYKQAADALDLSVKTIENHMGKAIKILRVHVVSAYASLLYAFILKIFLSR